MVRYTLIVFVSILLSGCLHVSPYRDVKSNEVIENKYLSFVAPIGWKVVKEYPWNNYLNEDGTPGLYKDIHGSNLTFHIFTDHYYESNGRNFFDKNLEYFDSDKKIRKLTKKEIKSDRQYGVTYQKDWIAYVNGLKCEGGVEIRGGGIGVKWYYISCAYYDRTWKENDGKRTLKVQYRYNYMSDYYNSLLQDKGVPREKWFTREEAEAILKDAVKQAVKTLKIKNIDIPRMEREGLMHYDKEFESTKF